MGPFAQQRRMIKQISICLTVILTLAATAAFGQRKIDLRIEGRILGYQVYKVPPTSMCGLVFPILIETKKVIAGFEQSDYIMVFSLHGGSTPEQVAKVFRVGAVMQFDLFRVEAFDRTIKDRTQAADFGVWHGADAGAANQERIVPSYVSLAHREVTPPQSPKGVIAREQALLVQQDRLEWLLAVHPRREPH